MKRMIFAIVVCSSVGMAASTAIAGGPQAEATPTSAEVQQQAMQSGPSSTRIGYLTQKEPLAPHRAAAPVDPKLLRPLTQREMGMLYNACIAYPECVTAYGRAYDHHQALLRAKNADADSGQ